jgi:hypothetical protein
MDVLLSLDYEILGNGGGDVVRDLIQPTGRLLDICDRHRVKMTIMFEVGEYWAFESYDSQLRADLGYSPCEQMKLQAIDAIGRGHDIQLHLHPQWIGAWYNRGVWRLQDACWRLADLPEGLESQERIASISSALCRGKHTLEKMLRPCKADYECICFRAGGFYAQPSGDIIRAMKTVGLSADSSVVKGYKASVPFQVDYSHVDPGNASWWTTDVELTGEGKPGENILELSVSSRMEPYWKSFKLAKVRATLRRRRIEREAHKSGVEGSVVSSIPSCGTVLRKILTKHASTFDFCKLSCRDMLGRIKELEDCRQSPVVMIGHSKDFVNDRQFDRFLAAASRNGNVRFARMSDHVQNMLRTPRASRHIKIVSADSGGSEA